MSSIAIMQPYLFPYVGYFQLINAVDRFVFYDDVHFMVRGWINRNKILINKQAKYFTVPCNKASQNRLIYEVKHRLDDKERRKLLRKLEFTYKKAPFFEEVYNIFKQVLDNKTQYISELAIESVKISSQYLGLECTFVTSSVRYKNRELNAADRLINICKKEKISRYINPAGGKELYSREYFQKNGIKLQFLQSEKVKYKQFSDDFVPWLSIIDVMMFNSPEKIKSVLLNNYKLN